MRNVPYCPGNRSITVVTVLATLHGHAVARCGLDFPPIMLRNRHAAQWPFTGNGTKMRRFSLRSVLLYMAVLSVALATGLKMPTVLRSMYESWRVGSEHERVVLKQPNFQLRITSLMERGTVFAAPGKFYRYEVRTHGEAAWRVIATVQIANLEPLLGDRLVGLSSTCAFFFDKRLFGVTTDGGVNWSCLHADQLPISVLPPEPYVEIDTVHIDSLGVGIMNVSLFAAGVPVRTIVLKTANFGLVWQPSLSTAL